MNNFQLFFKCLKCLWNVPKKIKATKKEQKTPQKTKQNKTPNKNNLLNFVDNVSERTCEQLIKDKDTLILGPCSLIVFSQNLNQPSCYSRLKTNIFYIWGSNWHQESKPSKDVGHII